MEVSPVTKMTDVKVNLLCVPENFFLALLNSNFSNFNEQKWITSNSILVGKLCESCGDTDKTWIDVQFEFPSVSDDNDLSIRITRKLQVVYIKGLGSEVIMTENDSFNMLKSVFAASDVPYINHNCRLSFKDVCCKNLVKPTEMSICLLNNFTNINSDVINKIVFNYFKLQRFLYKNDVFSIDVVKYMPELQFTKEYHNLTIIYFKVCEVNVSEQSNNTGNSLCGYLVDNTVSLYQLTTQNEFVPPQIYLASRYELHKEKLQINDFLKHLLPLYLRLCADKLMNFCRPFMVYKLDELQLKPLFLVSGPVGSGKSLLISRIAKRLGIHYWRIDCSHLIGGPSGFNEAKLKTVYTKLKKNQPCLLQLNNLEALSQDREGNEDVRIVNYFNKLLMELSCDLPVIIVGTTTSVDQLSFELQQNILHIINIDNPSLDERADTISWLCNLSHSIALKVAARTSGFILSDLTFLVSQAYREKYKFMDKNEKEDMNNELEFEDFVLVIDKMNSQFAGAIGAPQVPTVNWTDVGGHNEIKKEIVRSLNTADFGTGLRRSGILLWGPPGTGKTLLAKAVATECGSTFLSVKGPELLNMYVGQSEQNVRQVFERAREAAPCIIFFDELDSLAPNRGKSDSTGVMDRVVSQLLSEMDGLQKNDGVFVLGATNRPDLIDPALLRPGRLDKMLYVGPCEGTDAKLNVLKALTRKFKMNEEVDLYKVADSLPRCLTGADLYSVCYNAWQNAARNVIRQMENSTPDSSRAVIVTPDDFVAAVDNLALNS